MSGIVDPPTSGAGVYQRLAVSLDSAPHLGKVIHRTGGHPVRGHVRIRGVASDAACFGFTNPLFREQRLGIGYFDSRKKCNGGSGHDRLLRTILVRSLYFSDREIKLRLLLCNSTRYDTIPIEGQLRESLPVAPRAKIVDALVRTSACAFNPPCEK